MVRGGTDIPCSPPKSHVAPPEAFSPVPIARNPLISWMIFYYFFFYCKGTKQGAECRMNSASVAKVLQEDGGMVGCRYGQEGKDFKWRKF